MRLFTALDLPPEMLLPMEQLLAELRPEAEVKWSPLENLHITTKFIGEWPEERMEELDGALKNLRGWEPFDVRLSGLGWFPNAGAPRVLWAGADGGDALVALAAQTDDVLAELGIAKEQHPYSPHLTLARIKATTPLQRLRAKVGQLQQRSIGQFQASCFYLYQSEPGSHSSVYRKRRSYPVK